jgi:hypothetical protein
MMVMLERAFPTLKAVMEGNGTPDFEKGFELGFWLGFTYFQAKELKRHQKDIENCADDLIAVRKLSGLSVILSEIPADFFFEVPTK